MSISADIQSLSPGALVDMFEIDTGSYGLGILRYCPYVNEKGEDVVWQGNVYVRFPVKIEGFKKSSQGTLPRPIMTLGNLNGVLTKFLRMYSYLQGAKVTRRRTLKKYLDAVNFASGVNASADPNSYLPNEIYFIDRKSGENDVAISFELAVAWDVTGVMLPLRQVIRDTCQWQYRDADCGYTGPAVAKIDDTPTTNILEDRCSKHMTGCKLRYGQNASLPASFFPAVGLIRQ